MHVSATAPGFPAFEGGDVTVVHAFQLNRQLSSLEPGQSSTFG
jgi:hypothetical protein